MDDLVDRIENLLCFAENYISSGQRRKAVRMVINAESLYRELGYNPDIETKINDLLNEVGGLIFRV